MIYLKKNVILYYQINNINVVNIVYNQGKII